MAMKTTFLVQTFAVKRKRLVPGDREAAPTESGALKSATILAGSERCRRISLRALQSG